MENGTKGLWKIPQRYLESLANELKVNEKTVSTAVKQDLNPDLNHFDYAIWDVLENKIYATSHRNIGSLTIAIEEEWNKMSEDFILKAGK